MTTGHRDDTRREERELHKAHAAVSPEDCAHAHVKSINVYPMAIGDHGRKATFKSEETVADRHFNLCKDCGTKVGNEVFVNECRGGCGRRLAASQVECLPCSREKIRKALMVRAKERRGA